MLSWEFGTGWGCPRGAGVRAGPWQEKFVFRRGGPLQLDGLSASAQGAREERARQVFLNYRGRVLQVFLNRGWLLVTISVVTKVGYKGAGGGPVLSSANKRVVNPLGTSRQTKDLTPSANRSRTKTRTWKCRPFNNLPFSVREHFRPREHVNNLQTISTTYTYSQQHTANPDIFESSFYLLFRAGGNHSIRPLAITGPRPFPMSNPAAARTARLWELYRITDQDYESILAHQGGVCPITGKTPTRHLNIDHDHQTGLIRGLLSPWANKGLSFFSDDPDALEAAARYLRTPPAVTAIGKRYGLLGRAQRKKKMIYGGS